MSQAEPAVSDETVEVDAEDHAWLDERLREYRELLVYLHDPEDGGQPALGQPAFLRRAGPLRPDRGRGRARAGRFGLPGTGRRAHATIELPTSVVAGDPPAGLDGLRFTT